jgi:CDP-paratose 2-epimerase
LGGGRYANISVLEAVAACEKLTGRPLRVSFENKARNGDHQWWISDMRKFQDNYPQWQYTYTINDIIEEIYFGMLHRKETLQP